MAQVKTTSTVGTIVLEDADGRATGTIQYAVHPALRSATLVHLGVTYLQNRIEGGRWVYRATAEPAGAPVPHVHLADWCPIDHPAYDGPAVVPAPPLTCPTCGQVRRG